MGHPMGQGSVMQRRMHPHTARPSLVCLSPLAIRQHGRLRRSLAVRSLQQANDKSDPGNSVERSQSSNRNGKLWAELEENALSNFVETKDHKGGAVRNKEMQKAPKKRSPQQDWAAALGERWARTLYAYFNYRTGSVNDLQLLILLNISIILIGGALRHYLVVKDLPTGATPTLGQDLYRVLLLLSFANGMPGPEDSLLERGFSLAIAGNALDFAAFSSGLIAFALTVALVQQSVKGAIEANVQTGATLFEIDHLVVLGWGESQRDIEMMTQILEQVCLAYKPTGGRIVAVLSSRPKLEMEALFSTTVPMANRYGSKFLFRQGSPLLPESLTRVGAGWASTLIVVADSSRCPDEADAQSLRSAVLLDELARPAGKRVTIVVEARTGNVLPLLQAACSRRVIAVPTTQVAARRLARMVQHPSVADVSKALWSFASPSQVFLDTFPELAGLRVGDLALRFADGIVLGLLNRRTGKCQIVPPASTAVGEHDDLIMMRPTGLAPGQYQPLVQPLPGSLGSWKRENYKRSPEAPVGIKVTRSAQDAADEPPLNLAQDDHAAETSDGGGTGMLAWLGHQLQGRLGRGSGSNGAGQHSNGSSSATASSSSSSSSNGRPEGASKGGRGKGDGSMYYIAPPEFTGGPGNRESVLVCGWGDTTFMLELLRELDGGCGMLPKGTEVVLLNGHEEEQVKGNLKRLGRFQNVAVRHICGNPLHREDLKKVDMSRVKCAMVVCDAAWRHVECADEEAAEEHCVAADYLRLDAMILVAQLNIRAALDERDRPDINIVCEKVAFQGLTRFEDRHVLPLGVSTNHTAHSAKLLTQVAYNPKALAVYSRLNGACDIIVQDSSSFCGRGERLSFAELQLRTQAVDQVLVGYREVPREEAAIVSVLNPPGMEQRTTPRVWNNGDSHMKLITFRRKEVAKKYQLAEEEEDAIETGDVSRV